MGLNNLTKSKRNVLNLFHEGKDNMGKKIGLQIEKEIIHDSA